MTTEKAEFIRDLIEAIDSAEAFAKNEKDKVKFLVKFIQDVEITWLVPRLHEASDRNQQAMPAELDKIKNAFFVYFRGAWTAFVQRKANGDDESIDQFVENCLATWCYKVDALVDEESGRYIEKLNSLASKIKTDDTVSNFDELTLSKAVAAECPSPPKNQFSQTLKFWQKTDLKNTFLRPPPKTPANQ